MSNDDHIYVRKFRPSDFPQVRNLLLEAFVTGKGSVASTVKLRYLYQAPALTSYFLGAGGVYVLWILPAHYRTTPPAFAALALVVLSLVVFIALQMGLTKSVRGFCDKALATDMRDIPKHYAAGVFFVAVQPAATTAKLVEGAENLVDGEKAEQVLGFVGLEYQPDKNSKSAEVRRMVVGAKHRRRGLASRLMLEVLKHGETIRGLQTIKLGVSQYQPAARKLYEKLGWVRDGQTETWVGIINAYIARYSRPVKTKSNK
ncbi:acyl-CoA N-acyltransferase [Mycena alexandri]|uniref:Acyl-CoA N-acyltransferase n=1 Tax=Mycena alexandri TaxID=1745969 RepID=A0AAD6SQ06_9AGAR|nr:acyl-CoA N-acyltransferase [Mycena alexandri]